MFITQVVEGGSAIIGDALEQRDMIHANHIDMVKFLDPRDDGYIKVLYAIKVLLEEKIQVDSILVTTYYDGPPLDVFYRNCLLVLASKNSSQIAALPVD